MIIVKVAMMIMLIMLMIMMVVIMIVIWIETAVLERSYVIRKVLEYETGRMSVWSITASTEVAEKGKKLW
jgi:hypothetical protein